MRGSDCQTLAALGTARIDDGAACFGLHAGAETVGPLATDGRRLISAFHDYPFWKLADLTLQEAKQKNLLKNRVLNSPDGERVKLRWTRHAGFGSARPVDNPAKGE